MNKNLTLRINRLSIIVALILFGFGVSVLLPTNVYALTARIFGMKFSFPLNFNFISNLMVALLTATGMMWFLQLHPNTGRTFALQPTIIPAITAFILNMALQSIKVGAGWWYIFFLGGGILSLVILAEYIVVESTDVWFPLASAGLMSLTYILFLILLSAISLSEPRLMTVGFIIFPVATLLALRSIQLRTTEWELKWAVGVGFITTQFALALHYFPFSPLQYGVLVTAIIFVMTEVSQNLVDQTPIRRAIIEPLIGLAFFIMIGILAR